MKGIEISRTVSRFFRGIFAASVEEVVFVPLNRKGVKGEEFHLFPMPEGINVKEVTKMTEFVAMVLDHYGFGDVFSPRGKEVLRVLVCDEKRIEDFQRFLPGLSSPTRR